MSQHSTTQSHARTSSEEAKLPRSPDQTTLTEDSLASVCEALAASLSRSHELFVEGLKAAKCPRVITTFLSVEGGVLALSDQEREAILHLSQETLRASGASLVGGLVDFVGYAAKLRNLSSPSDKDGADASTAQRLDQVTYLINSLGERLIISLSTATSSTERQLSLTALSGLIRACDPGLAKLGAELQSAMNTALSLGAETPVWLRDR